MNGRGAAARALQKLPEFSARAENFLDTEEHGQGFCQREALGPSGRQKPCTQIPSVRVFPCSSVSQNAFALNSSLIRMKGGCVLSSFQQLLEFPALATASFGSGGCALSSFFCARGQDTSTFQRTHNYLSWRAVVVSQSSRGRISGGMASSLACMV
jgi:hypothetical protein